MTDLQSVDAFLLKSTSPAVLHAVDRAQRFAGEDHPILIFGPTGSGKSLLWQYVVSQSPRRRAPSFSVMLSSIADSVGLSELFGHRKGAFTSAVTSRPGLCRTADGGTLLLDEMSKASLELQGRLLDLVEYGRIRAVGSDVYEQLDIRIVAATNVRLSEAVRAGTFLEDLRHRLSTLPIELPSLAHRREDIPALAQTFLTAIAKRSRVNHRVPRLPAESVALLQAHTWPGNLRELQALLLRASMFADVHGDVTPEIIARELHYDAEPSAQTPSGPVAMQRKQELTPAAIQRAIEQSGGNRSEASRALGISRAYLYELLKRNQASLS